MPRIWSPDLDILVDSWMFVLNFEYLLSIDGDRVEKPISVLFLFDQNICEMVQRQSMGVVASVTICIYTGTNVEFCGPWEKPNAWNSISKTTTIFTRSSQMDNVAPSMYNTSWPNVKGNRPYFREYFYFSKHCTLDNFPY